MLVHGLGPNLSCVQRNKVIWFKVEQLKNQTFIVIWQKMTENVFMNKLFRKAAMSKLHFIFIEIIKNCKSRNKTYRGFKSGISLWQDIVPWIWMITMSGYLFSQFQSRLSTQFKNVFLWFRSFRSNQRNWKKGKIHFVQKLEWKSNLRSKKKILLHPYFLWR